MREDALHVESRCAGILFQHSFSKIRFEISIAASWGGRQSFQPGILDGASVLGPTGRSLGVSETEC